MTCFHDDMYSPWFHDRKFGIASNLSIVKTAAHMTCTTVLHECMHMIEVLYTYMYVYMYSQFIYFAPLCIVHISFFLRLTFIPSFLHSFPSFLYSLHYNNSIKPVYMNVRTGSSQLIVCISRLSLCSRSRLLLKFFPNLICTTQLQSKS